MSIIQERFKKARKLLGFSQNAIAKKIGVTHTAIHSFESGKSEKPNWYYGQYLIENGINPFYLVGLSDEIKGELLETISKSEHQSLQTEHEKLKSEFEDLQNKYEMLQDILQVKVDEDGNFKKRNK